MDFVRLEHWFIIKFLTKRMIGPMVNHEWMLAARGETAYWSKWFKWGRKHTDSNPCTGRLVKMTASDVFGDLSLQNGHFKVSTIA
jgi:hypothetical protein